MSFIVRIDWKVVAALGVAYAVIHLAKQLDAEAAKEVLVHIANTSKEHMLLQEGER